MPLEFDPDLLDAYDWDWEEKFGNDVREELARVFAASAKLVAPGLAPAPLQRMSSEWATQRAGELLTNTAETTKLRVKELVSQTIEKGESLNQLSKTLREDVMFSDYRAEMVSRTETATALGQGAREAADAVSAEEKAWFTNGGASDECLDNEADGWIPIDDVFSSGDDTIGAHPNCECDVIYRGGGDGSDVGVGEGEEGGGFPTDFQPGTGVEPGTSAVAEEPYAEIGEGGNAYGKWFVEEGFPSMADYSSQEVLRLQDYKDISWNIQNALRGTEGPMSPTSAEAKAVKHIDQALARHELRENVTLYRGIKYESYFPKVGEVFREKAYMSTTTDRSVAQRFSTSATKRDGRVLELRVPAGTRTLAMDGFGPREYALEREILLPRDTAWRVVSADGERVVLELVRTEAAPESAVAKEETFGVSHTAHDYLEAWQYGIEGVPQGIPYPTAEVAKELAAYRPTAGVKLYRAVGPTSPEATGAKKTLQSWTRSEEVANRLASHPDTGAPMEGWKVISRTWYPEEVLVDMTRLPAAYQSKYTAEMQEVVVKYAAAEKFIKPAPVAEAKVVAAPKPTAKAPVAPEYMPEFANMTAEQQALAEKALRYLPNDLRVSVIGVVGTPPSKLVPGAYAQVERNARVMLVTSEGGGGYYEHAVIHEAVHIMEDQGLIPINTRIDLENLYLHHMAEVAARGGPVWSTLPSSTIEAQKLTAKTWNSMAVKPVTNYALSSVREYTAETIATYLRSPEVVRRNDLSAYKVVKSWLSEKTTAKHVTVG